MHAGNPTTTARLDALAHLPAEGIAWVHVPRSLDSTATGSDEGNIEGVADASTDSADVDANRAALLRAAGLPVRCAFFGRTLDQN
jgi:hypothetical protein